MYASPNSHCLGTRLTCRLEFPEHQIGAFNDGWTGYENRSAIRLGNILVDRCEFERTAKYKCHALLCIFDSSADMTEVAGEAILTWASNSFPSVNCGNPDILPL
jgi:hypothetical protein